MFMGVRNKRFLIYKIAEQMNLFLDCTSSDQKQDPNPKQDLVHLNRTYSHTENQYSLPGWWDIFCRDFVCNYGGPPHAVVEMVQCSSVFCLLQNVTLADHFIKQECQEMLYFPAVECEIPYTQSSRKGFEEQSVVLGVRQRLLTVPIITEY